MYSYDVPVGSNGLKFEQLISEINNSGISYPVMSLVLSEDTLTASFDSPLSSEDQTLLASLALAHVPVYAKAKRKAMNVFPRITTTNSTNYYLITTFKYGGSDYVGNIDYLEIVSCKDAGATSYDIKIINRDTGDVIVSKTGINNNSYQDIDLGTITNVPAEPTFFEVMVRRNGGLFNNVYVEQIILYHGNETV